MKKIISFVLITSLFMVSMFSNEQSFNKGFSIGGVWEANYTTAGGGVEIGFPLVKEKDNGFLLRNHIVLSGKGGNGKGGAFISDKLIIGGFCSNTYFRAKGYGLVSIAGGAFGKYNDMPFSLSIDCGGGFEFQFSKFQSFMVEFGGTFPFLGYMKSSPFVEMGFRTYF